MAILTGEPNSPLHIPVAPLASPDSLRRFLFGCCGGIILTLIIILCLPYDPAVPFHLLYETDYLKAGWIYDRLHVSKTPVDIAVIGTSHAMNGVDSERLEQAMNATGEARDRRKTHVVNLAMPHLGDDLHDLIVNMLFATKQPRLLVIEIQQLEARATHPVFAELAELSAMASAPWGNPDLPAGFARLPRRQMRYFLESLVTNTVPADVADHWDDTYQAVYHGNQKSDARISAMAPERLLREAAVERSHLHQKTAGYSSKWGWLFWHYNEAYLVHMLQAVKARNIPIVFLYLPVFGTQVGPVPAALLEQYGKILTPPAELLNDPTLWFDREHLNHEGSRQLTAWLAKSLAVIY